MSVSSSSSAASVRSWRTAFLTVRDESLTSASSSPSSSPILQLLDDLIFSNSQLLISAASHLPPDEVSSDLLFLLELVAPASHSEQDIALTKTHVSHLIHDISRHVCLEFNSTSWVFLLDSFGNMVEVFLRKANIPGNVDPFRPLLECLETVRHICATHRKSLISRDIQVVKFLLRVITGSHHELFSSSKSISNRSYAVEFGKRIPNYSTLLEVQIVAFSMLGEAFSRLGTSFPVDVWRSVIEVIRKVMDVLASKSPLVEDNAMSRFYLSLLHSLHLALADPKYSLSDHVSAFVASLRMFFTYGLKSNTQLTCRVGYLEWESSVTNHKSASEQPKKINTSPYRPPHLRKRGNPNTKQANACNLQSLTDQEPLRVDNTSSDSDYSDSDGQVKDADSVQNAKVRVAAIACIQDLCQADPKAFTTQWTVLLPTGDVLLPRKFEATLMTCLLFDPSLKAKVASASTLAVMLDGTASGFLQIAEYRGPSKSGSFTALSISLGQILIQLHTGILHLIQSETHGRLLTSLLKILMRLISSTPYARMPEDLLPTVIKTLHARIEEGFLFKSDQTALLAASVSCLTAAFSTSPSLPQVREMLYKEVSAGSPEAEMRSGVFLTLLQYSEQLNNPTLCFEALQALRAISHNYPQIMNTCWVQVSSVVHSFLRGFASEDLTRQWKGQIGSTVGIIGEKVFTAAVRVLDECLRAISGFKGTEDLFYDKIMDAPFTSDCKRMKKVASAPSYEPERIEDTEVELNGFQLGISQWSEAIENHMPHILFHASAMVRAASVTCFAGITSSVFSSLTKEKQDYIVSSLVNAAHNDEVPSVRSAACRAIGVISCFPQVSHSAEILGKFIHVVEINTRHSLVSVKITASWAFANVCDSIRHCIDEFHSKRPMDSNANSHILTSLINCALRLVNDGDKIKSNAVRALGNLSRFVKFSSLPCGDGSHKTEELPSASSSEASCEYKSKLFSPASLRDSCQLERMVQALISCVTNGNVKVQWNVCHALSNLFLNETLRLQDMDWAPSVFSILLLLLRDSSNYKIRIQAAAALAVPASVFDYGKSFSDVVQGLEHTIENLGSDYIAAPSSFKYKVALEKQVTFTMLHVLSLASSADHQPLKEFLVKKASFLEEWFKLLCSSLGETNSQPDNESKSTITQKREMISNALQSLIEVYMSRNQTAIAKKIEKLSNSSRLV